ncbi:MAG: polysaccharide deacetylase family protein [Bacteroidota bacterium]
MKKILIYTTRITNRNRFIFNFIFQDVLGAGVSLTSDSAEFSAYEGPKFSYAHHPVGSELFFQARNILFETGITEQNITVSEHEGTKIFFATGKHSALPFDPFAAAFYLVSRYEEYLPHIRDVYDRYDAKESLAYQSGFLQKPIVDIWAMMIRDVIRGRFPDLVFPERKYRYISTIDIDNAYAYKEKGFVRTAGGFVKNLIEFDANELKDRFKVFMGLKKDPYDTYDVLLDIQKKYRMETIYFFLLADYGMNDKNVPVQSRRLQLLIKSISDYSKVGIHPSFGSNARPERLRTEIRRLSGILNAEVTRSRQHFLKLVFPDTYRNLIEADIKEDYTMGFATQIGFRAGTCTAFNFYDLDQEVETKLRVFPFAVMDATLRFYMKVSPEEAVDRIRPVVEEVKKVNGTFISLWHNESISNNRIWQGWEHVYEEMVKVAL